ncbi:MAG: biotin--[acetyl-CoA-carboxylase] ligase [Hyphomicrobiales bacterium]|nr:biotin--[acetyl-CoA-carboxylase] ligase [Hyphomicrobiales bacterium]
MTVEALPEGYRLFEFQTLDSTQSEMKRRMAANALQAGDIILAAEQTSGMGRQGRHWHSPLGNLYFSLALQPDERHYRFTDYGFVTALALHHLVRDVVSPAAEVTIKWPNDVLVEQQKIAGILLERLVSAEKSWLIIGVGLNIRHSPQEGLRYPATHIAAHNKENNGYNTINYLNSLMNIFNTYMTQYHIEGFPVIANAWNKVALALGTSISVRTYDSTEHTGAYAGVDESGNLLLKTDDGKALVINAGDVMLP